MATKLQSFVLKKKSFTLRDALKFARRHGAKKVDETLNEYRVRVHDPANLRRRGFTRYARLPAAPGIDVVIAAKGRIQNPPRGAVGMIPGELEQMLYRRKGSRHPGPYQHTFGKGAMMFAMPNGDVVIRSMSGRRLWGRY